MSKVNDVAAMIEKIGKCSESLIIISEQISFIAKTVAEILAELQKDSVDDADDVETNLKEIRIDCQKCGDYICLNF